MHITGKEKSAFPKFFLPVPSSWSSSPVQKSRGVKGSPGERQKWWRAWVGHDWVVWGPEGLLGPCLYHLNPAPPTWVPRELLQPVYLTLLSSTGSSKCTVCLPSGAQLLGTPWTWALKAHLSMGSSRQEYWSMLPFPVPGDLPVPGIEPASLGSPALAGRFLITALPGRPETQNTWHSS